MQIKERSSDCYVGTADIRCAADMLEIERIRKTNRIYNMVSKQGWSDTRFRVEVKARGPRAVHARADGLDPRAYDMWLPIRHAETLDVYIYTK
jgi:hypothetical protein